MLSEFLSARKPHRPLPEDFTETSLARAAGTSLIVAQEVSWGMYNPLPPKFEPFLSTSYYQKYRQETRKLFGAVYDFPEFTTFHSLAEYFESSFQELCKCFCLQRALADKYDEMWCSGTEPHIMECALALSFSVGPDYYANRVPSRTNRSRGVRVPPYSESSDF